MTSEEIITQDDNPHALIVRAPDQQAAMVLMDRMDLEQAMAELRGEVIQTFVYLAKDGKKQPTYAGIKEAARLYRNVHFGATATPLADGSWMITSYAHNLADNTRCDYPMPYPCFDPRDTKQAIEFRASISKSIRNALAAVLPIAYLNTMIARWMEEKSGSPERPAARVQGPVPARNGAAQTASAAATRVQTTMRASAPAAQQTVSATDLAPQQPDESERRAKRDESWEKTKAQIDYDLSPQGQEELRAQQERARAAGDADFAARAGAALDAAAELRAEVVELLTHDGGALDLLKTKGTLPPQMSAEQLAKTKRWLETRAARNAPHSTRLARQIEAAGTEEEVKEVMKAAQAAKDARQITQAELISLLRDAETRRTALAGPLTAGAAP